MRVTSSDRKRLGWALVAFLGVALITSIFLAVWVDHHTAADTEITGLVVAGGVYASCPVVDSMGAVQGDGDCPAAVIKVSTSSDPARIAVGATRTVTDGTPWIVGNAYTGRVPYPDHAAYFQLAAWVCAVLAIGTVGGLTAQSAGSR